MIIKKWDTTLNSGAGGWAEQYPKTVAQKIFDNAGTTSIFDVNDRIKIDYLPNAVFDSLYFYGSISSAPNSLATLADVAITNAASIKRSALGYYWVGATNGAGVTASPTVSVQIGSVWYRTVLQPSDEGTSGDTVTGTSLEAGDWLVITKITGLGTSNGSPIIVTFGVVENTYELMTGATNSANGAPGLVPTPLIANELQFLRGNGTWATPTNTTYAVATANGDDIYKEKINLTGSDSSTDTVQIAVNATSLRTFTGLTTNGSTTIASVADTAGLLVGQLVTGTGIPANALITDINPNTSVTISIAATVNGGGTYTASTFGLTIEQASDIITIRHADTSSASNLASTARTYVSGLTFDTFGHVIGYTTGSETVVNTNTTYDLTVPESTTTIRLAGSDSSNDDVTLTAGTGMAITRNSATQLTFTPTAYTAGNGINLSSFEFTVGAGEGLTQEATGLKMTYPVYHGDTLPTTGISANAIGLEW
jgi:hypothetical protein